MSDEERDELEEGEEFVWRSVADVKDQPLEWLAEDLVPYGYIVDVIGLPGSGKTAFFAALAAQVTGQTERFKGSNRKPQTVIWLTKEEGYGRDISPRIEAAGGDPNKCIFPTGESASQLATGLSFPEAEFHVKEKIKKMNCGLLLIEGLADMAEADVNINLPKPSREFMHSLIRIATETSIAIVSSRHPRKDHRGNLLDLGMGPRAFGALARMSLFAVKHPKIADRYFLATIKQGPAKSMRVLEYAVPLVNGAPVFQQKGYCDEDVGELLKAAENSGRRTAIETAREFLTDYLKDGEKHVADVEKEGKARARVDLLVLREAAHELGVMFHKHTEGNATMWKWHKLDCECKKCGKKRAQSQSCPPSAKKSKS